MNAPAWPPAWDDAKVDQIIGGILQAGVIISALLVFIGGVLYCIRYGRVPANYETFRSGRAELLSLSPVIQGVLHGDGRAIIQLGLLFLIATPVVRVAFSILAFWRQRDRIYVPVTLIVFAILLYSLFGRVR